MKKIYSLFILSILALTMFVGCQMPANETTPTNTTPTETTPTETPTEDPVDDTPTVDADETTYGFTKTVNYTVVANGQSLPGTKTGAELIALAKEKNLIKDTDYTINGTTVTLTASGVGKYLGYSLSVNASDGYLITGGGMKEAGKTVTIPITHYDGTDYKTPTATELYLVKVYIRDSESNDLDIPVTITEDHKITFTMPEKNINVFAQFCDIRYQKTYVDGYKAIVNNYSDNKVTAVLCFNKKVYDNLEEVDEKYVLKVGDLEKGNDTCTSMYFTSLCDNNLSTDGTLNDNQYTFGVIVVNNELKINELKILKKSLSSFSYNPDEGLQSN